MDDSVLDWKPSGAEPTMSDPKVQEKIVTNDAVQIQCEGYFPNPNKGYLIALDENGEIAHSCITSESMSVSSSEFVEARKAREAKHSEYERLAEEAALKRKLMEQEADAYHSENGSSLIAKLTGDTKKAYDIYKNIINGTKTSMKDEELLTAIGIWRKILWGSYLE